MLPIIPQDKANHFVYGSVIAVAAGLVASQLGLPVVICSIGAAAILGATKEVLDYYQNWKAKKAGLTPMHGVEFMDFAATALGGCAVNVLLMMCK
jgi:hypothetical protein